MAWEGANPGLVINTLWQWVTFGVVFFVVRQVVCRPAECRAIVAVMIALAVCLSVYAFYQYTREHAGNAGSCLSAIRIRPWPRWESPLLPVRQSVFSSRVGSTAPSRLRRSRSRIRWLDF